MSFPYRLKPFQKKALQTLSVVDHLILISATGSGKSLVFQKYILDRPRLKTILISPLNALSRQHVQRFQSLGIPAFLERSPNQNESGVWVMSPERWKQSNDQKLKLWKPGFLIVDEAHCVEEWGKNFRPDFSEIFKIAALTSIRKSLWCSATLPLKERRMIEEGLRAHASGRLEVQGNFEFPQSIRLQKFELPFPSRMQWLWSRILSKPNQSGMVFCNTRALAEYLQRHLNARGIQSICYHAGRSSEERRALEAQISQSGKSRERIIVIATSAFGMGMDFDFFRFCILYEPPLSLLSLVQSVGRIGRSHSASQQPLAEADLLWSPTDFIKSQGWFERAEVRRWYESLENPKESLENHFNDPGVSCKIKGNVEFHHPSH